ncbi:MAG: hypothetical protein LBE08_02215 [Bifidobacteriaceae bacterium]|nr:hypothetical protein [Bifidobacteriaceae bacterium]
MSDGSIRTVSIDVETPAALQAVLWAAWDAVWQAYDDAAAGLPDAEQAFAARCRFAAALEVLISGHGLPAGATTIRVSEDTARDALDACRAVYPERPQNALDRAHLAAALEAALAVGPNAAASRVFASQVGVLCRLLGEGEAQGGVRCDEGGHTAGEDPRRTP